jgi:hypothetical protein
MDDLELVDRAFVVTVLSPRLMSRQLWSTSATAREHTIRIPDPWVHQARGGVHREPVLVYKSLQRGATPFVPAPRVRRLDDVRLIRSVTI